LLIFFESGTWVINEFSWYTLTTERVIGVFGSHAVRERANDIETVDFGNFKGYGDRFTEIMTLSLGDNKKYRLEYETGSASMAPIYYFKFWDIKFPIIDKLSG